MRESSSRADATEGRVEQFFGVHAIVEAGGCTEDIGLEEGHLHDEVGYDRVELGPMEARQIHEDFVDRLALVGLVHFRPLVLQQIQHQLPTLPRQRIAVTSFKQKF